jgi:hypothetical protein
MNALADVQLLDTWQQKAPFTRWGFFVLRYKKDETI